MRSLRRISRILFVPAMCVFLVTASGCQAVRNALGQSVTPGAATLSAPLPSPTQQPQFLITPNPNNPTAMVEKTPPPVVVLTQPTPTDAAPRVTLAAGISKPSLVQIDSPGPDSKIRDFVWVRANVYPGDGGNVNIQLTGEDGRTIALREMNYSNWTTGWLSIAEQIQFTPIAASETALLSVYTKDAFGRIITLASERILMLQVGPEEVELPGFHGDPFVMTKPVPSGTNRAGSLYFEGFAHVSDSTPLIVEMLLMDGSVLASTEVPVEAVTEGKGYVAFSGTIAYQVNQWTPVRFTVRQESSELSSITTALSSYIIYLDR